MQTVAGVRLVALSLPETASLALDLVGTDRAHGVFTCNVDHLVQLAQDSDFASAYRTASVVTADGAPVVALARMLGGPVRLRVTGADLVPTIAAQAAETGVQLALVGGADGVALKAGEALLSKHPSLRVVAAPPPPLGFDIGGKDDIALVERLRSLGPSVVVVCFGAPKQELWIAHHLADLPGSVLIGAGATLDFLAGVQRRAPVAWQRLGVEFLWRLLNDWPRMWRRYLVQDMRFIGLAARELVRHTSQHARARAQP